VASYRDTFVLLLRYGWVFRPIVTGRFGNVTAHFGAT
jgi:hypothetical protein